MASPYFSSYSTDYSGNNLSDLTLNVAVESGKNYQIRIYSPIYDYYSDFSSSVNGTVIKSFSLYASETVECSVKEVGYAWSDVITVELADNPSYSTTKIPSYYPEVTHQWVWDRFNNSWYGQAGSCVANALTCLKDIHEYLSGKGSYNRYSIGWIYGNRLSTHSQSEGMMYEEALSQLKNDGVPYYKVLPENSTYMNNSYYFRDVYFYTNSAPTGVTAKQLVSNNYTNAIDNARAQRISDYGSISVLDISSVKQHVIDNGCALIVFNIYDNIYDTTVTDTGIVPRFKSGSFVDGHMMVIMGWKKINGINYWICQNGWGSNAGDNGIYYFPFFSNFGTGYFYAVDGDYPEPQLPSPTLNTNLTVKTSNSIQISLNTVSYADKYYARINGGTPIQSTGIKFLFSGLTPNTQYFIEVSCSGESFANSNWAGYYATTLAMVITPWEWTTTERTALNNNGNINTITYTRWNELVNKVNDVLVYLGETWNSYYTSKDNTLMTSTSKNLTALRFNSLRYNIGTHISTGISEVAIGNFVYGSYFITLETKLNEWIANP